MNRNRSLALPQNLRTRSQQDLHSDDDEHNNDEDIEAENCFPSKNRSEVSDETSDIVLVVVGQNLHVSKSLLMIHSPVFKAMFTDDFQEKNLKEIPLETTNYDAMVNLLEQIYPGRGFELMKDNTIEDLLELADKYQVEQVFTNCKAYIEMMMEYQPPINKTLLYLKIVEQYGHYKQLHSLRERLVKSASLIPSNRIKRSRHYSSLPPTAQRCFLPSSSGAGKNNVKS